MAEKIITAGGQAIIEGVMMRSPKKVAMAVRKPNGKIIVKKKKFISITQKNKILGFPFIRGIISLFEMLSLGIKALNYSAQQATEEEEEELSSFSIVMGVVLAFVFALGLFKFVPLLLTQFFSDTFALVKDNYILFNIIDGVIKIILFIGYVLIISLMGDVKRLFQYHGAEHKAVNCYEAKKKLTLKNVKKYRTLHARCGTSFILIVLILSILVYTFIPKDFSFWMKLASRIILLPIIAGLSYELLKLTDRFKHSKILGIFTLPGLLVQKITTREPTNKQVEVAIKALKAVIK